MSDEEELKERATLGTGQGHSPSLATAVVRALGTTVVMGVLSEAEIRPEMVSLVTPAATSGVSLKS